MEKELKSYNVKPVVMCCERIILGKNCEERLVGVNVNHDKNKDKYYVICPSCGFYQFVDKKDIHELL